MRSVVDDSLSLERAVVDVGMSLRPSSVSSHAKTSGNSNPLICFLTVLSIISALKGRWSGKVFQTSWKEKAPDNVEHPF